MFGHVVDDDDVLVRVPSPSPRWRDWTLTSEPSGRIRSLATSTLSVRLFGQWEFVPPRKTITLLKCVQTTNGKWAQLSERIHTSTLWEVWHCEMEKCNEVWPMWFRGIPLEFTGRARMQGCSKVLTLCNEVRRHRRLLLTLLHSPLYGIALCLYLCIHNCIITLVHLHFCICICIFVFIHLCLCNKVRRHRRPLLALPHPRRQQLLAQALFSWRWEQFFNFDRKYWIWMNIEYQWILNMDLYLDILNIDCEDLG